MFKRFFEWIKVKTQLHKIEYKPPFVHEKDIWWFGIGENVGQEINGKSVTFSRPGLIYKKLAKGFYLIIPTTTVKREGSWFLPITIKNREMYLCLHQIRTIDYRRLYNLLGQISEADYIKTKKSFFELYK